MKVSWDWLNEYVSLDGLSPEEVAARLTMSGLNLEHIERCGGDVQIDLEVTSNRPDCLGHIGVAREIAVLFGRELKIPPAEPREKPGFEEKAGLLSATRVDIECPDLCPRYVARVIRGMNVGPSPKWMRRRLETIGVGSINNLVDITNYVLMECGQPLHAFDFDKLHDRRIIVRRARQGEKIVAIDQREYALDPEMCIIADADRPVAIGGVMGGLDTEIGDATRNVLIEVADFAPVSIRNTARKLHLHSPSSYRFERKIDPYRLDWASRRCCELILELAGGELLEGSVYAGSPPEERAPIGLRFGQIPRVLGIDVPADEAVEILTALGLQQATEENLPPFARGGAESGPPLRRGGAEQGTAWFVPPTWRRDLEREADLIEEVARIHGYDKIPDDVPVPLAASSRNRRDRVTDRVRDVLCASGYFEAITLSFITEEQCELFTPRGELPKLRVEHSSRKQENVLRQSLVPSLLASLRENERQGTFDARLFEIARVYLKAAPGQPEQQTEPTMIGLVGGRSFRDVKGVTEALVQHVAPGARFAVRPSQVPQFTAGRGAELFLDGKLWGWLGELDRSVTERLKLHESVMAAELNLAVLELSANLTPAFTPLPEHPAVERDLNFILDEAVTWQELETTVRDAGGGLLESIAFVDQYRGEKIGPEKKSYVLRTVFRAADRTLTGEEVDAVQQAIVRACEEKLRAALR